jgi:hypothetical protein
VRLLMETAVAATAAAIAVVATTSSNENPRRLTMRIR